MFDFQGDFQGVGIAINSPEIRRWSVSYRKPINPNASGKYAKNLKDAFITYFNMSDNDYLWSDVKEIFD